MSATRLPETMTHWTAGADNGTGGKSFAPGVAVPCRHADKAQQVQNPEGAMVNSKHVYYSEAVLKCGDMIRLGDLAGAPEPTDADIVINVRHIPTMSTLARMAV